VSAVRIAEQNPLFASTQRSFARGLLRRFVLQLFGDWDWQGLAMFAARSWPIANGRIESGTVTQKRTADLGYLVPFYTSEITYSYAVGGEYYSGYVERTFVRESSAYKFVNESKDKEIVVRYKPDLPTISCLRKQDQPERGVSPG